MSIRVAKEIWFVHNQNLINILLEMSVVLAKLVSTKRNANVLTFMQPVPTLRSYYGCGTCGAWLYVHKVAFTLQGHVKTTKTADKLLFFQPKEDELGTQQAIVNIVSFQSTKSRKEELCVDNKVQETIGDVYCPKCGIEMFVYISIKKTSGFYDCKKCKNSCLVLNILFEDQKRTIL